MSNSSQDVTPSKEIQPLLQDDEETQLNVLDYFPKANKNKSQQNQNGDSENQIDQKEDLKVQPADSQIGIMPPLYYDFVTEVQLGNFSILFLMNDLDQRINQLDHTGYTILHHAITYNKKDIVVYLVDNGADLFKNSMLNQSCLMLSCNFGLNEIFKFLLDQGANLNEYDSNNFTPFFYAWKGQKLNLVLYIMCLQEDFKTQTDRNGCTLYHWAAYNNNVFLLKLLDTLNIKQSLLDKQGMSPLDRACNNFSYEAIKYIINKHPEQVQSLKTYLSFEINQLLKDNLNKEEGKLSNMKQSLLKRFLEPNNYKHLLTVFFILTFIVLSYSYSMSFAFQQLSETTKGFTINVSYFIILVYWVSYSLWFIYKTPIDLEGGSHYIKNILGDPLIHPAHNHHDHEVPIHCDNPALRIEVDMSEQFNWYRYQQTPPYLYGITQEDFEKVNFDKVNQLNLKWKQSTQDEKYINPFGDHIKQHSLWYKNYSIFHHIYYLYETKKFYLLNQVNRICPICLQYQPPRTFHCDKVGQCVEDYSRYSTLLQRCIYSENHFFYLLLLLSNFAILSLQFLITILTYHSHCSSTVILLFEVYYKMYLEEPFCVFFTFIVSTYIWFLTLGFLIIEVYGVFTNLTYHEIMNRELYPYLYETFQGKKYNYFIFKDRFTSGIIGNFQNYFTHQFNKLKTK